MSGAPKIGTLAYATDQGLGYLAKSFYDAGVVTDVLLVRHPSRTTHYEWYPGARTTAVRPFDFKLALEFCLSCDAVVFFETPFDWRLVDTLRGVRRTALVPMHECMPVNHPQCDVTIAPSRLEADLYGCQFLPVPVEDSIRAGWRQRQKAEVFVHNMGHGGLRGRNGTAEFLAAIPFVNSPTRFLIRSQENPARLPGDIATLAGDKRVHLQFGTVPREQLYAEGDVFVFPEKFNGLSLPLQEAYASGMLVMATDRYPMRTWLPKAPLIPYNTETMSRIGPPYREYREAIITPAVVAAAIDEWYGHDIADLSFAGKLWGSDNSWHNLRDAWIRAISGVS